MINLVNVEKNTDKQIVDCCFENINRQFENLNMPFKGVYSDFMPIVNITNKVIGITTKDGRFVNKGYIKPNDPKECFDPINENYDLAIVNNSYAFWLSRERASNYINFYSLRKDLDFSFGAEDMDNYHAAEEFGYNSDEYTTFDDYLKDTTVSIYTDTSVNGLDGHLIFETGDFDSDFMEKSIKAGIFTLEDFWHLD